MKTLMFMLILILFLSFKLKAESTCQSIKKIYVNEVKKKILTGVPFKILITSSVCRKDVHFAYDIWDEKTSITINEDKNTVIKLDLPKIENDFCNIILCNEELNKSATVIIKILLNPLWGLRLKKLKESLPNNSNSNFTNYNLNTLTGDLVNDKVLFEGKYEK